MIPSDEAIGIGQPSTYFLRNIITTVLDVTVTGWANVLTAKTLSKTCSETEIAGNLCREMKAEKKRRQLSTIRIEEEVGTHSSLNSPKPEGRIDVKLSTALMKLNTLVWSASVLTMKRTIWQESMLITELPGS